MNEKILLIVVGAVGLVVISLTLSILLMKSWRQGRITRQRRKRRAIEPCLLRYLGSREGGLERFIPMPVEGSLRAAVVELLLEHTSILKGEAMERITLALEQLGMVREEIGRLRSGSAWRRAAAAERLGLARSPLAVEPLAKRLEDPDEEVRLRAGRALGQIRGKLAVRPLIAALSEPSRWSTMRVAEILSNMGSEAEEELIRAYADLAPKARVAALDILGRLRRPGSASFIEQRLRDEDPDVRARAAHALGQIGDPTTYRSLLEAMQDPEWPVRAMAAKALGRLRVPDSAPALALRLRDRQWWVRSNSAQALIELGETGTRTLLDVLDSPDIYARHQAVLMLQQTGLVDRYVDQLCRADEEATLARRVVSRIAEMGRVDRLEELSRVHRFESVRETLAGILAKAAPASGARA